MKKIDNIDNLNIEWNGEDLNIEKEFPGYLNKTKESFKLGETYSIERDGKIICLFGFIEYINRHYYVYLTPTKYAKKYIYALTREIKIIMKKLIKEKNPLRIGTESLSTYNLSKWHNWLGFKCEGTKYNYIGNRNYNIWRFEKWE